MAAVLTTLRPSSRLTGPRRGLLRIGLIGCAAGLGAALVAPASPAIAADVAHSSVVTADPADWTPDVVSGAVHSLAQSGGTMVAGGAFDAVRNHGSQTALTR